MNTPLITIVIPTYRRLDMLAELLEKVCAQIALAPQPVDAIVVDNCPDGSARKLVHNFINSSSAIEYLHQPISGVVHARNAGTTAATGEYILFLDDDEVPAEGWLAGFLKMANQGVALGFGRIKPRFEQAPAHETKAILNKLFSRDYAVESGTDITRHHVELGTGNALFHKATCLGNIPPFDLRFNRSGGEDIWLIKSLSEKGLPLVWVPEGLVEELVPKDRMSVGYLQSRRFTHGRLRCLFYIRSGGLNNWFAASRWMIVGLLQTVGFSVASLLTSPFSKPQAIHYKIQVFGGLGKLFWWKETAKSFYAKSD